MIAAAAGSVGYYLALTAPEPTLEPGGPFGIEARQEVDAAAIDREAKPTRLRYRAGPDRRLEYALEQSGPTGSPEIVTRIEAELAESRRAIEGEEAIEYERTYDRVGVAIDEDGEAVQADIAAQIESLLQGTRSVATRRATGAPGEFEWRSVTNPQVRQTLNILRHGGRLLTPRLRDGAVNPGEGWEYRLPASGLESRHVRAVDGEIAVEEEFVGIVEAENDTLGVVDRSLELEADGEVEPEDAPDAYGFELRGEGTGRVLFDVEAGAIVQSRLTMSRRLKLEDGESGRERREGRIELLLQEAER